MYFGKDRQMNWKWTAKAMLSPLMKLRYRLKGGKHIYIAKGVKILKPRQIEAGDNINIRGYSTIMCVTPNARIVFEAGVDIGMFSRITAATKIHLGKDVLTGPNVFISNHNHKYTDIDSPVIYQGIEVPHSIGTGGVYIGEGTWIGINCVIVGASYIGKHCVIGANSVVTCDIPDYCVAVGSPCKVIKRFNFENNKWEYVETMKDDKTGK